jgi:hypothetical protein
METNPNVPMPIGLPINASLDSPIYVVGPQSLVRGLVGVGVPQSLIRPIGLGQLSSLPGNSTVIIDYSVIEPSVVVGVVNGELKLNLTSPVIDLLTSLITEGDLVMLYGNTSNLPTMEYLLAYSWARRYGVLYMGRVPFDYLIALPTIPIGSNQALAAAFGGPHYLVIGPVMPRDVVEAIMTYTVLKHLPVSKAQTGDAGFSLSIPEANLQSTSSQDTPDVCYSIYSNYSQAAELSPGVYESSNYYFVWLYPMTSSSSYPWYGVVGYSDGNGTFYYDTCLVISNQVGSPPGPYPYVPLYVYGYVGYDPTSTMTNNGGEVLTETGTFDYYTSYKYYNESITNSIIASPACTGGDCLQPQPTSSTTSYPISVFAGVAGAEPYAGFEFTVTLPSGSSEGISLYYGPSTRAFYANVGNVTWTFNLNNANTPNDDYHNDFEDISPAAWIMPNFSSSQQSAYLPVYVSAKVLTMSRCYLVFAVNAYEYIWVDGGWWLYAQPTSSNTGLVSSATSYIPSPQLSGTYVSGIKSWKTPTPKLCWP